MTPSPINLDDGFDHLFNPLFPPPVHSTVDDFHFSQAGLGVFYQRTVQVKEGEPKPSPQEWCDMPTSSWLQLPTSLRWQRIN